MRTGALQTLFDRSLKDPVGFWGEAAEAVHWYKRWEKVLDDSRPPFYRWFAGGQVNTCYNALDLHVEEGRGDQSALIYDSPVTNSIETFTYRELRDKVAVFAGALARLGVTKGDRVIIYMPMIPEAAVAMFACARLGAIHSVVFGGFAANELAARIDDAAPKVVVSASCGVEINRIVSYKPLLDDALRIARHKPHRCVIFQREMERATFVADRDCDSNPSAMGLLYSEPSGQGARFTSCTRSHPRRLMPSRDAVESSLLPWLQPGTRRRSQSQIDPRLAAYVR